MRESKSKVVVVGSVNVDLVVHANRIPGPGETVLGGDLQYLPGGKGANQACAAAKAGGVETTIVGALGKDHLAQISRESLLRCGVNAARLQSWDTPSGTALITVDDTGENAIVVSPGANSQLVVDADDRACIAEADVLLGQLEIPLAVLLEAACARSTDAPFILNAAPSCLLPDELWEQIDILIVNEHEAADLVRIHSFFSNGTSLDPELLAQQLCEKVPTAIVTLGSEGSILARRGCTPERYSAFEATAIDTVGAGDTFCGALAARIGEHASFSDAMTFAGAAAAIAIERHGAQQAIPTSAEVYARMRESDDR